MCLTQGQAAFLWAFRRECISKGVLHLSLLGLQQRLLRLGGTLAIVDLLSAPSPGVQASSKPHDRTA